MLLACEFNEQFEVIILELHLGLLEGKVMFMIELVGKRSQVFVVVFCFFHDLNILTSYAGLLLTV